MIRPLFLYLFGTMMALAAPVELASDGKATVRIVVSPESPPELLSHARELGAGLNRITGASFEIVTEAAPEEGIVVGLESQWPGKFPALEGRTASLSRDDYLLQTDGKRLLLLGRTPHGVRNAVWGLLHELGFRQFFPGPTWEVWPHSPTLKVKLDRLEIPSYYTRRVGMNIWKENEADWKEWQVRNRMVSGFNLQTNHVYGEIIRRNKEHFEQYPEDIVGGGGKSEIAKLDPSRQTVLDVALKWALSRLDRDPTLDTVSMDPSDGGGWRTDSPLGSPSNQAVTLANYVAKALEEKAPGVKVGMYAYHEHSPPPDIAVHPNVIISVATAFIRQGHTAVGLMKAWHEKGASIGIREYLGVWAWSHELPGGSRASDLPYLFKTIPQFHELGARYWISEATAGWGLNGLGNYLTARLLWDVKEAGRQEALLEDFFEKAFEGVVPEAKAFFACILKENHPMLSDDLLGRMYRALAAALEKKPNDAVTARLMDLGRYTVFVEKMFIYRNARGAERQEAYDEMARWVYQTRLTQMIDGRGPFGDLPTRDKTIKSAGWFAPEGEHPLKVAGEVSGEELRRKIEQGVKQWRLYEFTPVAYGGELLPIEGEDLPEGEPPIIHLRGMNRLYLHAEEGRTAFEFTVAGGFLYQNQGPIRFALYADAHPFPDEPIATAEFAPDQATHSVKLETAYPGGHVLEINDGGGLIHLNWPLGQRVVLPSSVAEQTVPNQAFTGVFYVPEGTKAIGGFSNFARGRVRYPDGTLAYDFKDSPPQGYFSIPVPVGMDRGFWQIDGSRGQKLLMTVPAFFARNVSEMLVPREALEKSATQAGEKSSPFSH